MKFKTKDLLVTILPKHTVVGDSEDLRGYSPTPRPYGVGNCWFTFVGTCPTTNCCYAANPHHAPAGRPASAYDVESHRRELKARLKALDAYQAALEEEPSGAELDAAFDRLKADEARLEAALEGIRSAQQQIEDKRRQTGDED